jgi:26S proteasome regulatory subunit N1
VESFSNTDKYSASTQSFVKAGSLLASGILSSGVTSEYDAAHALLADHVNDEDINMKTSAIVGLGIAYAGTQRNDVLETLVPLIVDEKQNIEVVSLACLSIGLVFVGSASEEVSSSIVEAFMDRSDTDLKDSSSRMMCLGLALLYLGQGEAAEGALRAVKVIEKPIKKFLELCIDTCAYVGTGNVLQIQKLLTVCADHLEDDEKDPMKNIHQEIAVLGIAMVAMGETLASQMALRSLDHILQYGEVNIRRAIPIALGLLSISNPQMTVMDTLSKLSHDQDQVVSQNACFALGLLGAGTNNSRIANMLRQLAAYYEKEPNHLFVVRLAQGLLHVGKGLLTLNPFQSDSFVMSRVAMAGLLTTLHCALDLKNSFLNKRHYLMFSLACTVRPRCLVTVDENGKSIPVTVRVGQAVDTVGQAGKPRTITGFQTHKTPVLLAAGERAELGTDKYIPMSSVLEGFVVVKKNPLAKDRDDSDMKEQKDEKKSS